MSEFRRLRITSDGTPSGTRVFDAASGIDISAVVSVNWHLDMEGVSVATVKMLASEIDATTGARVFTICPRCQAEVDSPGR